MAPDCFARVDMSERFLAAEDELRSLQKRCRSLVVRTAVSAVAPPWLVYNFYFIVNCFKNFYLI